MLRKQKRSMSILPLGLALIVIIPAHSVWLSSQSSLCASSSAFLLFQQQHQQQHLHHHHHQSTRQPRTCRWNLSRTAQQRRRRQCASTNTPENDTNDNDNTSRIKQQQSQPLSNSKHAVTTDDDDVVDDDVDASFDSNDYDDDAYSSVDSPLSFILPYEPQSDEAYYASSSSTTTTSSSATSFSTTTPFTSFLFHPPTLAVANNHHQNGQAVGDDTSNNNTLTTTTTATTTTTTTTHHHHHPDQLIDQATEQVLNTSVYPLGTLTAHDVDLMHGLMAVWARRGSVTAAHTVERLLKRLVDDLRAVVSSSTSSLSWQDPNNDDDDDTNNDHHHHHTEEHDPNDDAWQLTTQAYVYVSGELPMPNNHSILACSNSTHFLCLFGRVGRTPFDTLILPARHGAAGHGRVGTQWCARVRPTRPTHSRYHGATLL